MLIPQKFPGQKKDEKVIFYLRRHWINPFKHFISLSILAVLPYIFYLTLTDSLSGSMVSPIFAPLVVLLSGAYYLFIWLFYYHNFVDFYLDVWIVTNQRIINIEQKGLFSRTISEQQIDRVQDVTTEIKGVLPMILGFGNIYVQTAGSKQRFIFKQIPHPEKVSRKILSMINRSDQKK